MWGVFLPVFRAPLVTLTSHSITSQLEAVESASLSKVFFHRSSLHLQSAESSRLSSSLYFSHFREKCSAVERSKVFELSHATTVNATTYFNTKLPVAVARERFWRLVLYTYTSSSSLHARAPAASWGPRFQHASEAS